MLMLTKRGIVSKNWGSFPNNKSEAKLFYLTLISPIIGQPAPHLITSMAKKMSLSAKV